MACLNSVISESGLQRGFDRETSHTSFPGSHSELRQGSPQAEALSIIVIYTLYNRLYSIGTDCAQTGLSTS